MITSFFNFRTECQIKYDIEVYDRIMDCFDALPLACVLNKKFLMVHGGISPDITNVKIRIKFTNSLSNLTSWIDLVRSLKKALFGIILIKL